MATTVQSPHLPNTAEISSQSLEEHEKRLVTDALAQAGGNQSQAARQLRIGRDALRYKMKKFGLL
jgi:DNA-binding NtrC family response regulator